MNKELQQKAEAIARKHFNAMSFNRWNRVFKTDQTAIIAALCEMYQLAQSEHQQEIERLKEALTAIANQPEERMGWSDQPYRMQNIAMCALQNIPTISSPSSNKHNK